MFVGLC